MDYNDLKSRLERVLIAMDSRFDEDIAPHKFKIEQVEIAGLQATKLSFGDQSKEELEIKILTILENLAKLKEHIGNKLEQEGKSRGIVENAIKSSFHLQVLMDIVTQEKHGTPLTKIDRTKLSPKIENIEQWVTLGKSGEPGSVAGITFDPSTMNLSVEGAQYFSIKALIKDKDGKFICTLDELIETSFVEFDKVIQGHLV